MKNCTADFKTIKFYKMSQTHKNMKFYPLKKESGIDYQ